MKISYLWLRELTGLDWSPDEMGERLTLCGTACEYIDATAEHLQKVVVGQVIDLQPVEGANKIRLATVDTGQDKLAVICGAPNVAAGQKIALAQIGARLVGDFMIKKAKIRGVESFGMICSERELGLSEDHAGIIVLPEEAPVGTPLVEYLDFDDHMMTFEITPNRPDSLCAIGIARDLAALSGGQVRLPEFNVVEADTPASDFISVKIDDSKACPRYAARVIRNVTVGESPWWLKKKIITAGMRPINNIVDVTNLVMLECGQPLHAFDLDRFGSSEVVVRRAYDKEKFTTLDGVAHELTSEVLMITNGQVSVAAGGVMGGLESEVEATTTSILLEAAHFNASTIRRGRNLLGLSTEASYRFERGADPNGIEYAINRAAQLFGELAGGEVCKGIVDCYPDTIEPLVVPFRSQRCNDILGVDTPVERMKEIFERLEFDVTGDDPMQVTVPTFRPDIEREIDLIEEVVRILGFEAIPDAIDNVGPLYCQVHPEDTFRDDLRRQLTGVGFDEIMGHGLANSKTLLILNPELPQVALANSLSEELNAMRNSLLYTALMAAKHNLAHRNMDLRLFEIGKTYFPPDQDGSFVEEQRLSLLVTGSTPTTWRDKPRPLDFYDLTGALNSLSKHFGWPALQLENEPATFFDDEVSYAIKLEDEKIGLIGRLSKKILVKFDVKQPLIAAELILHPLLNASQTKRSFVPLPVYPAAPRDLAILVDESVLAGDLMAAVSEAAGGLAESVDLFDLYQGKQIETGKKSIAVNICYRSNDRSLSSEEVDERQAAVVKRLKRDFNAVIRDK